MKNSKKCNCYANRWKYEENVIEEEMAFYGYTYTKRHEKIGTVDI